MNPADLVLTAADGAAFWLPVAWLGVIGFGVLMYVLLDGFVLGLGILGAWLAVMLDQIIRWFLIAMRFRSGKWKRMKLA